MRCLYWKFCQSKCIHKVQHEKNDDCDTKVCEQGIFGCAKI